MAKVQSGMSRLRSQKHGILLALTRITVVILCILSVGILSPLLTPEALQHLRTGFSAGSLAVMAGTGLWSLLCVLLTVLRKTPIRPGWAVGVDLIVWMTLAGMAIYQILYVTWVLGNGTEECCTRVHDDNTGRWTMECDQGCHARRPGWVARMETLKFTAGVIMAIVAAIEFAIFVRACIDCDRYRKRAKLTKPDVVMEAAERIINQRISEGILIPVGATYPPEYDNESFGEEGDGGSELKKVPEGTFRGKL